MATYIAMTLRLDGVESTVWQKIELASTEIVTAQVISYVDADGNPMELPEPYEMEVLTGVEYLVPGLI